MKNKKRINTNLEVMIMAGLNDPVGGFGKGPKKLSKEYRLIESQKSYEPKKDIKPEEIPKEVILLDDVITTGATLTSCKKALNQLGIEKVYGVSLFMVP